MLYQKLLTEKSEDNLTFEEMIFIPLFKHEGALYKEVFPWKIEARLSVTVDVR